MTDDEFRTRMLEAIKRPSLEQHTRAILIAYRDGGGTQERAKEIFIALLTEIEELGLEEEIVDSLRDTADLAWGWCAPQYRGWP